MSLTLNFAKTIALVKNFVEGKLVSNVTVTWTIPHLSQWNKFKLPPFINVEVTSFKTKPQIVEQILIFKKQKGV